MAIQPLSPLSVSPASAATNKPQSSAAAGLTNGAAPDEQMFLQLLVAQLKNQDPLNPTDGTQFVSQLAQFSNLEQTIAIRQNTDSMVKDMTPAASASGSTTAPQASN